MFVEWVTGRSSLCCALNALETIVGVYHVTTLGSCSNNRRTMYEAELSVYGSCFCLPGVELTIELNKASFKGSYLRGQEVAVVP